LTGGLVLAAGAGERFGGPKQLAELGGRPLLEHALAAVEQAKLDRVVVVLGARAEEVRAAVPLHGAEPVMADGWEEGMAASLRAGVDALGDCDAIVVVLGDQPLIGPAAIVRVAEARAPEWDAVRATYGGVPGHPVLLERSLFAKLGGLRGDEGARAVLREARVRAVPCDGLGRPDDVDTPEALSALEREGSSGASHLRPFC
jgi:CTP:molybdopterin cytidylyltransferase MocA